MRGARFHGVICCRLGSRLVDVRGLGHRGPRHGPPPSGAVFGWGANSEGELGTGLSEFVTEPREVPDLGEVASVGAGIFHDLVVLKSGNVMAWGSNTYGQLGDGTTQSSAAPVEVHGIDEAVAVTGGSRYSLALLKSGKVMAWGSNSGGELGHPGLSGSRTPVQVEGLSEVVAIAASDNSGERQPGAAPYNLALLKSGKVMVWGDSAYGIGHGELTYSGTPVEVEGLSEVVGIAAGWSHSLAVLKSGKVMAWGDDLNGEFGDGHEYYPSETHGPQEVSNINEAVAVVAGHQYSAALLRSGKVMAWGNDEGGVLGPGAPHDFKQCGFACLEPVEVEGLGKVSALFGGFLSLYAMEEDGTTMAWGDGYRAQLGNGGLLSSATPVAVELPPGEVAAIADNGDTQGAALLTDGKVLSWGDRWEGELGDGISEDHWKAVPEPVATKRLRDATQVAANAESALALLRDGRAVSWGVNSEGELGNGTLTNSSSIVEVPGLSEVVSVGVFDGAAAAVLKNGAVMIWGSNAGGQLGQGTNVGPEACNCSTKPLPLPGVREAVEVSGGAGFGLALLRDGTITSWGYDGIGELGDGEASNTIKGPVHVVGLHEVVAISANYEHSLALLRDGKVFAWGWGANGELGDGLRANSDVPVEVKGLGEVVAIAATATSSLAVLSDGRVMTWGSGFLDHGSLASSDVPVEAEGVRGAVAVAGYGDEMVLLGNGRVLEWGENRSGDLGFGTTAGPELCPEATPCSRTPVEVKGLENVVSIAGSYADGYAIVGPPRAEEPTPVEPPSGVPNRPASTSLEFEFESLIDPSVLALTAPPKAHPTPPRGARRCVAGSTPGRRSPHAGRAARRRVARHRAPRSCRRRQHASHTSASSLR